MLSSEDGNATLLIASIPLIELKLAEVGGIRQHCCGTARDRFTAQTRSR
jgi:hypothetical protein